MPENLKAQGKIIDDPNVETTEQAIDTIALSDLLKDLPTTPRGNTGLSTAKQQDIMAEQSALMGPQAQNEFQDYDPDLDRGIQSGDNQNDVRARNQTNWAKLGRGLVRFGTEATLGTLEATSLMLDFDMHYKALTEQEEKFDNAFSRYFAEKKEKFNEEYGKVYVAEEDEGFKPSSWSFWASNMDSVASTLTMMIPSTAAVKGLTGLSRMTKLSKLSRIARMSNVAKGALKGLGAATMSRLTENAMEAHEAVVSLRNELQGRTNPITGEKYTEEEINKAAGEAGVDTWQKGWAMMAFDVFQYGKMFKGFDYARRTATDVTKKSVLKNVGDFILKDMGSEGAEEGYQYIASKESQHAAKKKLGIDDKTDFWDRMSQYVQDDEFLTSTVMGALGGGIFAGGGSVNNYFEKRQQTKQRLVMEELHKKHGALVTGNIEAFNKSEDSQIIEMAIDYAKQGKLDIMEADLTTLENEQEDILEAEGVNVEEYRARVKRARQTVSKIGKINNDVHSDNSIPDDLKTATVANRSHREMIENRIGEMRSMYEELDESNKSIYEKNEKSTASSMVRLHTLLRNGMKEKAEELAGTIAESSDFYKSKEDVFDKIQTSNEPTFKLISDTIAEYENRLEETKKFEESMKTPEGQDSVRKEIAAAIEKQIKLDKQREEEKEENEKEESKREISEEEKAYEGKREAAVKEFGEYETTTPDGKKVFTTKNKSGRRTWVAGEVVKDLKGNMYRVGNPVKNGTGVNVYYLDKNGNEIKVDGEATRRFFDLNELKPESLKPGHEAWTVNKYQYDNRKLNELQKEMEIRRKNDQAQGVVKSVNVEFSNFKETSKGGNRQFDGDPKPEEDQWFDTNFELAAAPMEKGGTIDVSLKIDESGPSDAIVVVQDGKIISKLQIENREDQIDLLKEYIVQQGGEIQAQIIDKQVSFHGNLGNIQGKKSSVRTLAQSPFLPDGKIYIGSVKRGAAEMTFVSEDGSIMPLPWNYEDKTGKWYQGKKTGEGNTYIAMKTPGGDVVPVMLQESSLSEVKNPDGTSLAESVLNELNEKAASLTSEVLEAVNGYVKQGYTKEMAEKKAIKDFTEYTKKTEDTPHKPSIFMKEASDLITKYTREQGDETLRDKSGKPIKDAKTGKYKRGMGPNYFHVKFEFIDGAVVPSVVTSKPSSKGTVAMQGDTVYDQERMLELIGNRFMAPSIDMMTAESGGKYVKSMIDNGWFTTDVHAERPWVNPMHIIKLDDAATDATKGTAKVKKIPSKGGKKQSGKSSSSTNDKKVNSEDVIKTANKKIGNVTDLMNDPAKIDRASENGTGITMQEFVDTYIPGLVNDVDAFVEEIKETAADEYMEQQDDLLTPILAERNAIRSAAKDLIRDLILDAFESGTWNTATENTNGEVVGDTTEEDTKTDKRSKVSDSELKALTALGYSKERIASMSDMARKNIIKYRTQSKEQKKVEEDDGGGLEFDEEAEARAKEIEAKKKKTSTKDKEAGSIEELDKKQNLQKKKNNGTFNLRSKDNRPKSRGKKAKEANMTKSKPGQEEARDFTELKESIDDLLKGGESLDSDVVDNIDNDPNINISC